MVEFTRKEYDIIAKHWGIIEYPNNKLVNTLGRYDSRCKVETNHNKLLKLRQEKIAKIQNISKNELNQVKKFQKISIDELKEITRLRSIKNIEKLTK